MKRAYWLDKCPKCEARIEKADSNNCSYCGLDLRPYQTTCKGCGFHHLRPVNFCPVCGADFEIPRDGLIYQVPKVA